MSGAKARKQREPRPQDRPWSDRQVAAVLMGACAWKDGLVNDGVEWRDALANFIAAVIDKSAPVTLTPARCRLLKLVKVSS
jgi:hypothetical protein